MGKIKREKLIYNTDGNLPDDWEGFKVIEDKESNFDSEKGMIDHTVVVQRISDKKFFKIVYTEYSHGDSSLDEESEIQLEEVFEKEKTIKYYE